MNQEISPHILTSKSICSTPVLKNATSTSAYRENKTHGRLLKELNGLITMNSRISLCTHPFKSSLETHPENHAEKRKSSKLLKTLNQEPSLSALQASLSKKNSNFTTKKSFKSSKSAQPLSFKTHDIKQDSMSKISNKNILAVSCKKSRRSQRQLVNQNWNSPEKFKKTLSNRTENLPVDDLTSPAMKQSAVDVKTLLRKYSSKRGKKSSKNLFHTHTENVATEVSLCIHPFEQILKTPDPEKQAEKRKSARLLERCQLKTMNHEPSLSAPTSLSKKISNSTTKKSSKSGKSAQPLQFKTHDIKQDSMSKISNKNILAVSYKKLKRNQRQLVNQGQKISDKLKKTLSNRTANLPVNDFTTPTLKRGAVHVKTLIRKHSSKRGQNFSKNSLHILTENVAAKVSLYAHLCKSILEIPDSEKQSEKRKSPSLIEKFPLKTLDQETSLANVESVNRRNSKPTTAKSSKSSESSHFVPFESHDRNGQTFENREDNVCNISNKDILTISHTKLKRNQRQLVGQNRNISENFKKACNMLSNRTENLPVDDLTTSALEPEHVRTLLKSYLSKIDPKSLKKILKSSPFENHVTIEELPDTKKRKFADCPNVPGKGTLKRKRWLLNNLKEVNKSHEDDIFENQNNFYKTAFEFGDESDGSFVSIATPKFDFILTPCLPKKTPRFKDCISIKELLKARKSAEEYLFHRNKKMKNENRASSGKKASMNKNNTVQDIPEKKKLDLEEAVNKLIEVQNNLEIEAEVDDEEQDSYFSDAST